MVLHMETYYYIIEYCNVNNEQFINLLAEIKLIVITELCQIQEIKLDQKHYDYFLIGYNSEEKTERLC